jgi:type IV secretion system protein VirB9
MIMKTSALTLRTRVGMIAVTAAICAVHAAELPTPGQFDARVRYVEYRPDDVTVVTVRRGSVTRVVLEDGEKILAAATGFTADCSKDTAEWCVRADAGSNEIWVKPRDGATYNNLELKTDKRDYSFEFRLMTDVKGAPSDENPHAEPMFRVIFQYRAAGAASLAGTPLNATPAAPTAGEVVSERIAHDKPVLRNTRYSMQILKRASDIAPSLVFDDGRFTYFRFPNNREIPTIFVISPEGEEGRLDFHVQGDLVVVERLSRRFVLRLGRAVVGVWNEAFDPDGVPPIEATTVPGVERTIRVDANPSGSAP